MIIDSREARPDHEHDICVVGAGPVGISLAMALAKRGREVLLLESGGDRVNDETQSLSDALIVDPLRHDDMRIAVARRLGGTSTLWGGRCLPYDPLDFTSRPVLPDTAWPIGPDEIQPYLADACSYANCGAPVFEAPLPGLEVEDDRVSFASLERWSAKPRFQTVYREHLARSRSIELRLNTTVVGFQLDGDARIAALEVADAAGARSLVRARQFVLCAGGIETTRLLLVLQRLRPASLGGTDGPLGRHYMGHLIGEIADVQINGERLDRALDFFIDQHGSYVRRRFVPSAAEQRARALTNIAFWPVVPQIADPVHRSGPLSLVALALSMRLGGKALLPEAIRKRHVPDDMVRGPHVANVLRDLPGIAAFFPTFLWRRYVSPMRLPGLYLRNPQRRYGLSYHAEHLPNPESRVRLTDAVDRFGLPRVEIDLRFRQEDAEAVVRAHELLADWLGATGLGRIAYRQDPEHNVAAVLAQASHGTHQIGLARMAASPGGGVVDRDLACFGFDNLHVASSAVLPTSGQANPTLTTIALALRLAHRLAP